MNAISVPSPGTDDQLVILRCPNCHSAEPIKAAAISEGVQVVICRQCGEGWAAKPEPEPVRRSDCEDEQGRSLVWADARTIDAVRRPLVAQGENQPDPWTRRLEADRDIPEKRPSPIYSWLIVLISVAFLAGFFGARHQVVAAVPDLAGFYATIGLPAGNRDLDIVNVTAKAGSTGFETQFNIAGSVYNRSEEPMAVPDLKIEFLDRYSRLVRSLPMTLPIESLASERRVKFRQTIQDFPKEAVTIRVTFQNKEMNTAVKIAARGGA